MKRWLFFVLKGLAGILACAAFMFLYWYGGSEQYRLTGVPVLNYHQVNDQYHTSLTMTTPDFDTQMKYLHDNGYHTITPAQLKAYLTEDAPLPDKPVMLTFDDGYIDNYVHAWPILKKYDMTATIFIITGLVDKPRYLSWDNIQKMSAAGISFGDHTVSHKPLSSLNTQQIQYEITASKTQLENHLGKTVDFIAYPEGSYDDRVESAVKAVGYTGGFTVNAGRVFHGDDVGALNRVAVFESGQSTFRHFYIRLMLSTLCGYLWKLHAFVAGTLHLQRYASAIPEP